MQFLKLYGYYVARLLFRQYSDEAHEYLFPAGIYGE